MTPRERLKSPRLRLFVALDLPDDYLDRLVSWQEEVFKRRRDLRPVGRYSLHVTLVFLGYQAERDVERIAELCFTDPPGPFELRPGDIVEVPPRRPRLYAMDLEDHGGRLGGWQQPLAERLREAGLYEPEKRPFWPHLTVARFKQTERHGVGRRGRHASGGRAPTRSEAPGPPPELPDELRTPFRAGRLTLYRSTLRPQGAVYEPLSRLDLTAKAER